MENNDEPLMLEDEVLIQIRKFYESQEKQRARALKRKAIYKKILDKLSLFFK